MFYRQGLGELERGIIAELEQLRIYDCHEHLPPERQRLAVRRPLGKGEVPYLAPESQRIDDHPDAFTLFSHYCQHDLYTAGLDKETMAKILWKPGDLDWKWRVFKPYYERIVDTCFCRSAHIAMERFYGETRLTDGNYRRVSEAVAANSTPGLYRRVLRDACGIEKCINCDYDGESDEDGLIAQTIWVGEAGSFAELTELFGRAPASADEAAELAAARLADAARRGDPGMKMFAFDTEPVPDGEARRVFDEMRAAPERDFGKNNAFNRWFKLGQMLAAGEAGLACCVHTGYWNDYRELNPSYLLPFVRQHHFHRIDLYHVGYPYVREAIMLGKVWPGVRMNMAWTYLISRRFAFDALEEMLEMLPDNKIFGFGADYYVVEKVFGHLCMAREVIAEVLAAKIRRNEMTTERALEHARRMLVDNPKEFYHF